MLVLLSSAVAAVSGEIRLPRLVGDNMVLQQQSEVKIWGWSEPSERIKVTASWRAEAKTVADSEGRWQVTVATPEASFTPYEITVEGNRSGKVGFGNVLVGEVWLCSGQSNMAMLMKGYPGSPVEGYNLFAQECRQFGAIRQFNVARRSSFEPLDDVEGSWQVTSPEVISTFSATPYLFARELYMSLNVPIGIINSSWGGSVIEAWMSSESQQQFSDVGLSREAVEAIPQENHRPVIIYNAMLLPLTNYVIKGFCWYQGCSNVERYPTYADKMVSMIGLWRELWHNSELPFYYVEICPYNSRDPQAIGSALLREQQAEVMTRVANTGMVVTNDLVYPYEADNIHPRQKAAVAKRLACWALSRDYGWGEGLHTIGPRYRSVEFAKGKAVVHFDGVDNGFGSQGEISGFEIAGPDSVFYPATVSRAKFRDKFLTVWNDSVTEPVAVRYCFRNFLQGNLFDVYGMPTVPFRTDDF